MFHTVPSHISMLHATHKNSTSHKIRFVCTSDFHFFVEEVWVCVFACYVMGHQLNNSSAIPAIWVKSIHIDMNSNEICILAYFIEYIHSLELYTCAGIFNTYRLYVFTSCRQSKDYNKAPRLSTLAPDQCNDRHRRLVAPPRIRFPYTDYLQLGKSLHEDKSHRVPFNIAPGVSFIIIIFLELRHEKAANQQFGVHHISVISGHVRTPPAHQEKNKYVLHSFVWCRFCLILGSDNGPRVVSPLRRK